MAEKPSDLPQVGRRLRELRLAAGLTQRQLAAADFSTAYISQVERATVQPSLSALTILARRLNISPARLLDDDTGAELQLHARMCLVSGRRLTAAGQLAPAGDYLDQAADAAGVLGDSALLAAVLAARGDLAEAAQLPLEAVAHHTEAMELADQAGSRGLSAQSAFRIGMLYLQQGNPLLAIRYLKRSREAMPAVDALEAQLLAAMADCYRQLNEEELAVDFDRQALAACGRRLEWADEIQHLGDSAARAWASGRRWEALEHAERAWQLASYRRQLSARADIMLRGAALASASESAGLADRLSEQALAVSRSIADPVGVAEALLLQAAMSLDRGSTDRAVSRGSLAREVAEQHGDPRLLADAHWLLGRAELQRGNDDVARAHWEQSLKSYVEVGDSGRSTRVCVELGELALALGDSTLALRYFRQAASQKNS